MLRYRVKSSWYIQVMSYAPKTLLDLRDYLEDVTGLPRVALGIVGDNNHTYGYHLGEDRLPSGDYSAQYARDRNGLTDAASASDIGNFDELVALTAFLVAEARAGRAPDLRAVIGPAADGRAYRWDFADGEVEQRDEGDSHEWHTHCSWWRDSEHREKVSLFRRFFESDGASPSVPKAPSTDWTGELIMSLPTLKRGSKGEDVESAQGLLHARGYRSSRIDGEFGPKTEGDVKHFQVHNNTKNSVRNGTGDGWVGRYTWTDLLRQ